MTGELAARWLSYDELAEIRGIDRASAIRMVRRKRWPKQESNDGTTRVAVPASVIRVTRHPVTDLGTPSDKNHVLSGDKDQTIKALEGEAAALREALARESARADRAEAAAAVVPDLRERAARAEGEVEGLRAALRAAEALAARERATAQALLQAEATERQAAEMARAQLAAWTAGGPLTRALRAFFRRAQS
jgi:hypothetical protein